MYRAGTSECIMGCGGGGGAAAPPFWEDSREFCGVLSGQILNQPGYTVTYVMMKR